MCQAAWIHEILVVVAPDDSIAEAQMAGRSRVRVVPVGGETRRDSVRNALACLGPAARDDDWILVQDAARPGITLELLDRLKLGIESDLVGGLLAIPVADTVKRHAPAAPGATAPGPTASKVMAPGANEPSGSPARSAQTIDRSALWLAQTPQVFRFALLQDALDRCPEATDEASAIEALGHQPLLIPGARENFKVTTAEDYALMQRLLS